LTLFLRHIESAVYRSHGCFKSTAAAAELWQHK